MIKNKHISKQLNKELEKLSGIAYWIVDKNFNIVLLNTETNFEHEIIPCINAKNNPNKLAQKYEKYISEAFEGKLTIGVEVDGNFFFNYLAEENTVLVYYQPKVEQLHNVSEIDLLEHAIPDIICKINKKGEIIEAKDNQLFIFTLLSVGQSIFQFFDANDTKRLKDKIHQIEESGKSCNLRMKIRVQGSIIYFNCLIFKSVSKGLIIIFRDDTEKTNTEFELNVKTKAVEHSPLGIYVLDFSEKYFLYANQAYFNITGFTSAQVLGKEMSLFEQPYSSFFFIEESGEKLKDEYLNSIKLAERFEGEFLCRRLNGEKYWNHMISIPVFDTYYKNTIFVGIVQDVTQWKHNNEQLMRAIINTQEEERNRFSQDLHDGLGQILLATKMNLQAIDNQSFKSEYHQGLFSKSMKLLSKAINESRNISHNLMSGTLKNYGLVVAIKEMLKNYNDIEDFDIQLESDKKIDRFRLDLEIGLYRIIQEMLNNALKHAKANHVIIRLIQESSRLILEFKDDGIGFDKIEVDEKNHLGIGIKNIKSRTLFLGGQFQLNTSANSGTSFKLQFPLIEA